MLKTRKLISFVLVVAMVLSMGIVGMVSASAAEGDYYLMGSFNGWAITDGYSFSENEAAPGEYMLMGVSLSAGDTFKVKLDNGDGNTGWYPDGMGNDGTVDADGTYNIYFNPSGNPEWTANSGYCYLELAGEPDPDPTPDPDPETEAPQPDPDPETEAPQPDPDPETEAPTPAGETSVTINGVKYDAHVGDKIHYEYLVNMAGVETDKPGRITQFEGSLYYDHDKLTLLTSIEGVEDEDTGVTTYAFLPNIKAGDPAVGNDGERVGYNSSFLSGYNFSTEKALIHADFEVKADGASTITNVIRNLGSGEVKVVYLNEELVAYSHKDSVNVECPHGTQTDVPTTAPVTDEPTTPVVSDKAVVTVKDWSGTTETREFKIGDKFTVISYLQVPEGKRVNSIDIKQEFNKGDQIVKLLSDVDAVDDPEAENPKSIMFPQFKALVANAEGNVIKANGTAAKYLQAMRFDSEDSILIKAEYEVTANGTTTIETTIVTLATIVAGDEMTNQVMNGEKIGSDDLKTRTVFDGVAPTPTTAPVTDEPTTAPVTDEPTTAPVTDEPTTAPVTEEPLPGNTYYLTGSIAGWGMNKDYILTRTDNADAEEYTITVDLTTEDMIKAIKSSKSGTDISDWYPDGMDNNITVDANSTYEVLFRPNGDGTEADGWIYSWYAGEQPVGGASNHGGYLFKLIDKNAPTPTTAPVTDEPTTAPVTDEPTTAPVTDEPTTAPVTDEPTTAPVTEPPKPGLWVVADGKWYAVESGKDYDYVYYLNTGEKVCSLDAETFYDTDGLKLTTDTENEMDKLFPILGESVVLNDLVEGRLKYNYSAAKGKTFDTDDAELIRATFNVTAEEGVYYINTFLHTVAGADEHKYIFKDEELDPLKRAEGVIDGLTPDVDHPTEEPTTAPVTDEPTTAPVTDEPTTAPVTDEPTTAPVTDEPTTAPVTDEPTTAPVTDEPTTAPVTDEPTTAPVTDEPTDAPEVPLYYFEADEYNYYKESGEDLVLVVHNDKDDTVTFANFYKLLINDEEVTDNPAIAYSEGSLIITIGADQVGELFNDGTNRVAAFFKDEDGTYDAFAATNVNILETPEETEEPTEAPVPATSGKSTPDSGSTSGGGSSIQTGSTEMAIIFLVILVMAAGIVIFTKKRKFD